MVQYYSISGLLQVAATECDCFQIAVLINRVDYKKQRNYGVAVKRHLTFRRRIKSRLPFAGIIRMLPYSTRFQDKG